MSERSSRRTILQSHKAMSQNKPIELQLERDLQLCRILGKCCKDRGITPGYVRVLAVVIFKVSLYYWGGLCMFRRQGVRGGNSQPTVPSHSLEVKCLVPCWDARGHRLLA